jgi:hypothetical protein
MPAHLLALLVLLEVGHGADRTLRVAGPDDPAARVPDARYEPITSGTKSYRPVEPLPWPDVNRRVAPPTLSGGKNTEPKTTPPDHNGAPR